MAGGGQIIQCPSCQRLVIYGQTCVCGTNANYPQSATTHVVHKSKQSRGPHLNPVYSVWCSAGDLDLTGLPADLANTWVNQHVADKGGVKG